LPVDFKTTIRADLWRYFARDDRAAFWKAFREVPGFRFSYFLRKCQAARNRPRWLRIASTLLYRLLLNHYRYRYGFEIAVESEIGPGLYIGHFGHLTVHPRCRLGSNVNLSPGIVIGQSNRGSRQGVPEIGNCVWIGTNAIVVGRIKVGNNVMIAPGAYVNFDVPDNAVVVGNPGQIVSHRGTEHYVENIVDHI
jgi:serine O-acetyltransferase